MQLAGAVDYSRVTGSPDRKARRAQRVYRIANMNYNQSQLLFFQPYISLAN